MHLQGQKQRRTTDAATMQEKEIRIVQANSNSHNQRQNRAKNVEASEFAVYRYVLVENVVSLDVAVFAITPTSLRSF